MTINTTLNQLQAEVQELQNENYELRQKAQFLGRRVICPAGDGAVPRGAIGVIIEFDPQRLPVTSHPHLRYSYPAVGVWFEGFKLDDVHYFAADILDGKFEPDGRGVPTLMYLDIYEAQHAEIEAFLDRGAK